jgi:hypothetical protein
MEEAEMKKFDHFALEGLLRQGPHEVWVTLGRYETTHQVQEGARRSDLLRRPDIVATRVLPCYRTTTLDRSSGNFTSA